MWIKNKQNKESVFVYVFDCVNGSCLPKLLELVHLTGSTSVIWGELNLLVIVHLNRSSTKYLAMILEIKCLLYPAVMCHSSSRINSHDISERDLRWNLCFQLKIRTFFVSVTSSDAESNDLSRWEARISTFSECNSWSCPWGLCCNHCSWVVATG